MTVSSGNWLNIKNMADRQGKNIKRVHSSDEAR